MIHFDVRGDLRAHATFLGTVRHEVVSSAVAAANRAIMSARALAAREFRTLYGSGLKLGQIRARMKLKRASRALPNAEIRLSGKRITLFGNFNMRTFGRAGVRFGRMPWKIETISGEDVTPDMLGRAFRHRSRSGRAGVVARVDKARLPITVLVAPGVAQALDYGNIEGKVRRRLIERFRSEFTRVLSRKKVI